MRRGWFEGTNPTINSLRELIMGHPILWDTGLTALYAEFGADGGGDGLGVVAHERLGFGLDHDAGESFGAGVADDDAAGVGKLGSAAAMVAATVGIWSSGRFSRTCTLTMTWGKVLRSAVSCARVWPLRWTMSSSRSAVSRPSPVVACWR